jgi:hypothetical protein
MTSKQTYPCFTCRKAGFEVQVFLDGKDEHGNTKRLNMDGTRHYHQQPSLSSTAEQVVHQYQGQQPDLLLQIKLLDQKIQKILDLLQKGGT